MKRPTVSRYGATTPALLKWFDAFNQGRDYADHQPVHGNSPNFRASVVLRHFRGLSTALAVSVGQSVRSCAHGKGKTRQFSAHRNSVSWSVLDRGRAALVAA
jgi:hypothetical protein